MNGILQKDVRGRFEKCKEEAIALLNATKESCGVMNASSSGITGSSPHITKETLTKGSYSCITILFNHSFEFSEIGE